MNTRTQAEINIAPVIGSIPSFNNRYAEYKPDTEQMKIRNANKNFVMTSLPPSTLAHFGVLTLLL